MAHILARVLWGHLVQPQPGAVGLSRGRPGKQEQSERAARILEGWGQDLTSDLGRPCAPRGSHAFFLSRSWGKGHQPGPPHSAVLPPRPAPQLPYLVVSGEAAPTLVPRDLGVGLSRDHAIQVHGLPFGHVGGRGLDSDGHSTARDCGHRSDLGTTGVVGASAIDTPVAQGSNNS